MIIFLFVFFSIKTRKNQIIHSKNSLQSTSKHNSGTEYYNANTNKYTDHRIGSSSRVSRSRATQLDDDFFHSSCRRYVNIVVWNHAWVWSRIFWMEILSLDYCNFLPLLTFFFLKIYLLSSLLIGIISRGFFISNGKIFIASLNKCSITMVNYCHLKKCNYFNFWNAIVWKNL